MCWEITGGFSMEEWHSRTYILAGKKACWRQGRKTCGNLWKTPRRLLQSSGQEMVVVWVMVVTMGLAKSSPIILKVELTGFTNSSAGEREREVREMSSSQMTPTFFLFLFLFFTWAISRMELPLPEMRRTAGMVFGDGVGQSLRDKL